VNLREHNSEMIVETNEWNPAYASCS